VTDEESLTLKRGERLEWRTLLGGRRVPVLVISVRDYNKRRGWPPSTLVRCRDAGPRGDGRKENGRLIYTRIVNPSRLHRPRDLPPAAANVYADWLEDNGEPAAAAKLRAAFPLGVTGR
jgi:hypothetical protein